MTTAVRSILEGVMGSDRWAFMTSEMEKLNEGHVTKAFSNLLCVPLDLTADFLFTA
jgi:hypothetical protein